MSSDKEFFEKLPAMEQRRFFLAAKEWLDEFVGKENAIAAIVHMDEKTPHLHYSHVPVTRDGRLCAKDIYTKQSLRDLQSGLTRYLKSRGFKIERGVEQGPGSFKKHLNTREFKQQKEAEKNLQATVEGIGREVQAMDAKFGIQKSKLQKLETLVQEAETSLAAKADLPQPGFLPSKAAYSKALEIIETQNKALADKKLLRTENEILKKERQGIDRLIANAVQKSEAKAIENYESLKENSANIQKELMAQNARLRQEVKVKEGVIDQLRSHFKQYNDDHDRLKAIEKKWLKQEREKEAKARQAEAAAKAREPQLDTQKTPLLQPQSPRQNQAQPEERKNLSLGR